MFLSSWLPWLESKVYCMEVALAIHKPKLPFHPWFHWQSPEVMLSECDCYIFCKYEIAVGPNKQLERSRSSWKSTNLTASLTVKLIVGLPFFTCATAEAIWSYFPYVDIFQQSATKLRSQTLCAKKVFRLRRSAYHLGVSTSLTWVPLRIFLNC